MALSFGTSFFALFGLMLILVAFVGGMHDHTNGFNGITSVHGEMSAISAAATAVYLSNMPVSIFLVTDIGSNHYVIVDENINDTMLNLIVYDKNNVEVSNVWYDFPCNVYFGGGNGFFNTYTMDSGSSYFDSNSSTGIIEVKLVRTKFGVMIKELVT